MKLMIFLSLFLFVGCTTPHLTSQSSTFRTPSAESSLTALQAAWAEQNFTDPAGHNPASFRYLIHTTVDINSMKEAETQLQQLNSGTKSPAPYILSASVISESRGLAYSESALPKDQIGFVITSPTSSFLAAYRHDSMSKNQWNADGSYAHPEDGMEGPNNFEDYKVWLFKEVGLLSPQELLAHTYMKISDGSIVHIYNEVDIEQSSELRATAVFFFDAKMANLPRPENPARSARLKKIAQDLAKKYKLPFLNLKAPPILTKVD